MTPFFSGPCLGFSTRNLPDSRSCLQIGRLHCLLLHSALRHATHILPHRPFAGPAAQEPGNDRKCRLGQRLVRPGAHPTYVFFCTFFSSLRTFPFGFVNHHRRRPISLLLHRPYARGLQFLFVRYLFHDYITKHPLTRLVA